jgi:hypothetical protein
MTKERVSLEDENYLQQFHNLDHYDLHGDEEGLPMSWELPPVKHRATGGSVISQLRNRSHQHEPLWHDKFRAHVAPHPARSIPGVHIVTAEAGEPVFTGEL